MCEVLAPAGFDDWANFLILCDEDPVAHALTWLRLNGAEGYAAHSLFSALKQGVKCILVEQYYFDIDHRSEVELIQATQFATAEVTTDRIHFFSLVFNHGDSIQAYLKDAHNRADARRKKGQPPVYLGYSILRSRRDSRIGRSLISPWAEVRFRAPRDLDGNDLPHNFEYSNGDMLDASVTYEQVRTAVPENVNIYGYDFRAIGVPFMEQDGYILRCAHVSAWICHYSGVLRGMIPRRTTGQIHKAGYTTTSIARSYPSTGVSPLELGAILRAVQLAPESLDYDDLVVPRKARTWADRDELFARSDTLKSEGKADTKAGKAARTERRRLWLRENLTATVCRYLNSGLPIILSRQTINHTQVVVGYLRASDFARDSGSASARSHSDVTAFLVSDDQEGPFELVYVDEIIDELLNEALSNEVYVPLPDAVWVSGQIAEQLGASIIQRMADQRVVLLDGTSTSGGADADKLREFADALSADEDTYTMRTYVTAGTDFKRSCAQRMKNDPHMVDVLHRLQFPRFVWVCEVIDRGLRAKRSKPSVVATIVLDATQLIHLTADEEPAEEAVEPLFAHFPRYYYAPSYQYETRGYPVPYLEASERYASDTSLDEIEKRATPFERLDLDEVFWHPTKIGPYFTGRWGHRLIEQLSPTAFSGFTKGAVGQR